MLTRGQTPRRDVGPVRSDPTGQGDVVPARRPRPALFRVPRWAVVIAALACVPILVAAGCTSPGEPGPAASPPAAATERARPPVVVRIGETFRNGSFELRVTMVRTDLTTYRTGVGATARSRNGQFVLVHVFARNVGLTATRFGTRHHRMVDTTGREVVPEDVRGFDYQMAINPEATTRGIIVYDIAKTVEVSRVVLQSDDNGTGPDASTIVDVTLPRATASAGRVGVGLDDRKVRPVRVGDNREPAGRDVGR